jgi:hypothetical protein
MRTEPSEEFVSKIPVDRINWVIGAREAVLMRRQEAGELLLGHRELAEVERLWNDDPMAGPLVSVSIARSHHEREGLAGGEGGLLDCDGWDYFEAHGHAGSQFHGRDVMAEREGGHVSG